MGDQVNPPADLVWAPVAAIARAPAGVNKPATQSVSWTEFRGLPNFDIRNGATEDIEPILIRATLDKRWHWVPVAGVPPDMANKCVDGYLRSAIHHLTVNADAGANEALNRKLGIVLGTIRAASTTFYRMARADVNPAELAPPVLTAYLDADGNPFYVPSPTLPADQATALNAALDINAQEQAVISALISCGAGVIPMQGYSLVMTNHHYLSSHETQSRKVFAVVEKAFWVSQTIGAWFTDNLEALQDAAWHKACHPVNIKFKLSMAMDLDIKDKLNQAGVGACASRLPAAETELRTANSYLTLLNTVRVSFQMAGGDIDTSILEEAYDMARRIPPHAEGPEVAAIVNPQLRQRVVNRKTAIALLADVLRRNQADVAYCYGFYCAQSDAQALTSTAPVNDTLKVSFSLKKLRENSVAAYHAGVDSYSDYAVVRNRKRAEGTFVAKKIVLVA